MKLCGAKTCCLCQYGVCLRERRQSLPRTVSRGAEPSSQLHGHMDNICPNEKRTSNTDAYLTIDQILYLISTANAM